MQLNFKVFRMRIGQLDIIFFKYPVQQLYSLFLQCPKTYGETVIYFFFFK